MAFRKSLILRACESFASMGFGPQHLVPQSSRRPLYVVKFLPKTERFTGSEEAAKQLSRRTHRANPADLQFFHIRLRGGDDKPFLRLFSFGAGSTARYSVGLMF